MLSGWHVGFKIEELWAELRKRFGWDKRRQVTNDKLADILGQMDRLRDLLRNCQVRDDRSCAVCGDIGHQAAECHHIDQVDPGGGSCAVCGEKDHESAECHNVDLRVRGGPAGAIGPQRNVPIGIGRALDELEKCICERIAEHGRGQFVTMLDDLADIIGSDAVLVVRQAVADKEFDAMGDMFRDMAVSCVLMSVCLAEVASRPGARA